MDNSNKSGVTKQKFGKKLDAALKKRKKTNNRYLTKTKFATLIKQIKSAKKKRKGKTPNDYQRLKRFDVIKENRKERLIVPNTSKRIYYITKDELYDAINEAHLKLNHGAKTEMHALLKENYQNVTHESIAIYLSLCTICKGSKRQSKVIKQPSQQQYHQHQQAVVKEEKVAKEVVIPKGLFTEVKPRGTFYFIDMQQEPDGDYKYIIVYEDDITKFIHLKPLKKKDVKEIADILMDIFSTFGVPNVLQSGSDEEMANGIIGRIKTKWSVPQIKHEKIYIEEPSNDINKIIYCLLCRSAAYKWSEGLRFIQYIRNITYNSEIHKSPFEAMFGRKGKLDISSLNLPQELIGDLRPEEEDPAFPDSNDNMNILEINNMLEVVMDVSE